MARLVAIGGSDAGISAGLRARELDPDGDITLLVADAYPNFSICGIPYYISGEVADWRNLAHRTLEDLQATGMKLQLDTRATRIDPDAQDRAYYAAYVLDRDGNEIARQKPPALDLARARMQTAATRPSKRARASSPSSDARLLRDLAEVRSQTLALVAGCTEEQLTRVHSPIMSPLAWDLGHIAAYEDLWVAHRLGGLELLRPELASVYDAFETPRAVRSEVAALRPAEARGYAEAVRARTSDVVRAGRVGDGLICEMVLRHELQHCETMRQTLAIAGLLPEGEPPRAASAGRPGWTLIEAGEFDMGAAEGAFAYDNERPRHRARTGAFRIARVPVSNENWLRFSEAGGYVRREWWSDEGWAWKERFNIAHHPSVAADAPSEAPVCHVSWFEADAFARAHDARLPSEAEWERAAAWGQETPALAGRGDVWEWTTSWFDGYPGFVAHPYREYSEVFFGSRYRVLRGSSWATHPRVASLTFRNWDLPERRQIFAGVRLAREA